jgi:2-dehydropantoate 2-reductase
MEVLVLGAGAVGCYLGGQLARSGHKVTLVSRRPTAEAIRRNGLTIIEGEKQFRTQPTIVPALREAFKDHTHYDAILLTVKSYDAQAALYEMVAFCPSVPTVITVQNGIGIEELFIDEFTPERIVAGSLTTPLSHETANSVIVERSDRGLALAPAQPGMDISDWADLFHRTGIETMALNDYRSMKWSKALLNMIGNATSAILNRHPKLIYDYGPTYDLEMEMLSEALAVMKAQKLKTIDLPGAQANRLATAVKRLPKTLVKPFLSNLVTSGRGNKMPSFHIDIMAGREQNEVAYHNGAVSAAGERLGIPTPVNQALNDILMKIAHREIDYEVFNGRPKRLVAAVQKYKQASKKKK